MKKLLITVFSLYGFLCFVLLMILLLPAFFLASLFGPIRGGNAVYRICAAWSDAWFLLIGIRSSVIHEAKKEEQRPCIFVANHQSYMDIPMIVNTIREPVRVLGKQEMAAIPIFGYVYRNAAVMVNRKDAQNRAESVKNLKQLLSQGISIFIFPEGTFNETGRPLKDFYDGAFRIAIETNTSIQPLIFPDTPKRLNHQSVFSLRPGKCRAVYLPMIHLDPGGADEVATLKQRVYQQMEIALQKYLPQ